MLNNWDKRKVFLCQFLALAEGYNWLGYFVYKQEKSNDRFIFAMLIVRNCQMDRNDSFEVRSYHRLLGR